MIKRNLEAGGGLYINKWQTGVYKQRSPLFVPVSAMGVQLLSRLDTLWDGLNIEISSKMTLVRRNGFSRYCSAQFGTSDFPLAFYSFKNLSGTIKAMADTQSSLSWFNTTSKITVFPKTSPVQLSMQKVASVLYVCNGTDADMKKWDGGTNMLPFSEQFDNATWSGTATVTPNAALSPFGLLTADQLTDSSGSAFAARSQAIAVAADSTSWVASIYVNKTTSVTNTFGINVSYSGGTGISTTPRLNTNSGNLTQSNGLAGVIDAGTYWRFWVTLPNNGTNTALNFSVQPATGTNSGSNPGTDVATATGSATVFGAQLEPGIFPSDYNALTTLPAGGHVTKWGISAPSTAPAISLSAGSLSPLSGYTYGYVYKNSSTGHVSTMSPVSGSTGKQTSKNIGLSGDRSTDPQVDKIDIYRIDDGGGDYFFLAEISNPASGPWSYTDSTPDSGLNDDIVAPTSHANDPPPSGISLAEFHLGRMWVAAGNILYFAGGPDTTNGVPEEAFPPANNLTFPDKIMALASTSLGLLVFTVDDAYVVVGTDATSFVQKKWQQNFGVASQNCLAQDGDLIFVFTSKGQLFQINTQLSEIGFPIQAQLGAYTPANIYMALHRSGADEGLFISNGSTDVWRYSVAMGCWSTVAQPVGGVNCVSSIEVSTANYRLMMGRATASGYILSRDTAVFADDGSAYSANAVVGSLIVAPPRQVAIINSVLIEAMPVGTYPTVSVLLNEISGTFTALPNPVPDPPLLVASTTVLMKRHDLKAAQTPLPQQVRHLQVQILFPTEAAQNEVLGLAID